MSVFECAHSHAHVGLDGCYCPDCQQTFSSGTKTYEQIIKLRTASELSNSMSDRDAPDTKSSGEENATAHSHQFTPVWQSDCQMVGYCKCGEKRECNIKELQESLTNCINLRTEYLLERDRSTSKARKREFAQAIAVKDKQIAWLENQILERSHSVKTSTETPSYLALDEIRLDGGTQPRAAIDLKHVKLLEDQMEDGFELEPVTVFYDGSSYWLADGYHRWQAHHNLGLEAIACIIHQGNQRDAILFSVGANADHKPALPRSREDKRRAVLTLLQDPEWGEWSDREIARACKVSDKTVGSLRKSICGNSADTKLNTSRKVQRKGKTYTVNTTNIGKKAPTPMENLQDSNRLPERDDHPLNPRQSDLITQLPSPDSLHEELDAGERDLKPTIAHHLKLSEGGLVEVKAPGNSKINGRRGRIASVSEHTVSVWLRNVETMTMHKHTLKHEQVEPLPLEQEPHLKLLCDRLDKLRECSLDPFEVEIVNLLERTIVLTPTELEYLAHIEKRHGITQVEQSW